MTKKICPGQDTRFWSPDDIFNVTCAGCGKEVEFFKDEASRRCPDCGSRIQNPKLKLGCAQWCEHAKECLGFDPKEMKDEAADEASMTDQLIATVRNFFGEDRKRINHAQAVFEHARELLKQERANPRVVLAAALLHDVGIKEAEKKYGSAAGVYQEKEGPPIAKELMEGLGVDKDTIEHVCAIVANHHSAKDIDTPEFRIIWDADWLVNLPDEYPNLEKDQLAAKIDKIMKTEAGRKRAYDVLLG